jgi:hypothetical protein
MVHAHTAHHLQCVHNRSSTSPAFPAFYLINDLAMPVKVQAILAKGLCKA